LQHLQEGSLTQGHLQTKLNAVKAELKQEAVQRPGFEALLAAAAPVLRKWD